MLRVRGCLVACTIAAVLICFSHPTRDHTPKGKYLSTQEMYDCWAGACNDTCLAPKPCGGLFRPCGPFGDCFNPSCGTKKTVWGNNYAECGGTGDGCSMDKSVFCATVYNCSPTYVTNQYCGRLLGTIMCLPTILYSCAVECYNAATGTDIDWSSCV